MDSLATLTKLGSGKFIDDLAGHLTSIAQEVMRTGNKGAVSATITVEQFRDTGMVIFNATVQPKPPSEPPVAAAFFAADGALWNNDPRQPQMDLRLVDEGTGEIRETTVEWERRVAE